MNRNSFDWKDMSTMPDAGDTVLIHVPNDVEPVWFGFWDGRRWHYIEGLPVRSKVCHWCVMPLPPARDYQPVSTVVEAIVETAIEDVLVESVA